MDGLEYTFACYQMRMDNLMAIGVETLRIDSGCSLEK